MADTTKTEPTCDILTEPPGFSIDSFWAIIPLLAISVVCQTVIFPPIGWWPLAYSALVPWILVIGACRHARRVYVCSYLMGFAFAAINVRFVCPITVPGYVALSFYLALYYPLTAWIVRHGVRRRRLPMVIAFPIIWVAGELLRANIVGFPWFFLGHSQYTIIPMIQISDLFGAYGVSFVVAAVNGALVDLFFAWLRSRSLKNNGADKPPMRKCLACTSLITAGLLVAATLGYGWYQISRDTFRKGPKVAVIQGDYPMTVSGRGPGPRRKADNYHGMIIAAERQHQPDLVLLPETPWHMYLNKSFRELQADPVHPSGLVETGIVEWSNECWKWFDEFVRLTGATLVTGSMSRVRTPEDVVTDERKYNSAFVFKPGLAEPDRYDKIHVVWFGEKIPFRYGRLRFLYLWFNSMSPWGEEFEYSIDAGSHFRVFTTKPPSDPDTTWTFGVPICYEDVMPYMSRRFVLDPDTQTKRVDFLLNISNDGWFLHSVELPQHLAICVFRAVENRVGIARAVNTGISGFIDPNGRISGLITDQYGNYHGEGIEGYSVDHVLADTRFSIYTRYGDWFAWLCLVLWLVGGLDYIAQRVIEAHRRKIEEKQMQMIQQRAGESSGASSLQDKSSDSQDPSMPDCNTDNP